jgi:hypothetical protein
MKKTERVYRACLEFLEHLFQSVLSVLKVFLFSKFNSKLPGKEGETIAILGNGPSLKISIEKYKSFFQNTTLFCVNRFASAPEFEILKPQNYLLLDPGFFEYDEVKHSHPSIPVLFNDIEKKTTWKLNLFVPFVAKKSKYIAGLARNSNVSVYYFNKTLITGFTSWSDIFFKLNLGMPRCTNVLCGCLFLSLRIGYKKIYLFGADHSWHEELRVADDNSLLLKDFHFDDKPETVKESKLYESIEKKEPIKIHRVFWWAYKAFSDYLVIGDYAKKLNADICNASEKSYIDAFRREKPSV